MKNIFWSPERLSNLLSLQHFSEEDKTKGKALFEFGKKNESAKDAKEEMYENVYADINCGAYETRNGFLSFFCLSEAFARRMGATFYAYWYDYFTFDALRYCAYLLTVEFEATVPENKR